MRPAGSSRLCALLCRQLPLCFGAMPLALRVFLVRKRYRDGPAQRAMFLTNFSCLEARYVLQTSCSQRLPQFYPLLALARSKQDPINRGHGAQYLYRPAPASRTQPEQASNHDRKSLIKSTSHALRGETFGQDGIYTSEESSDTSVWCLWAGGSRHTPVAEKLSIHGFNGCIGRLKAVIGHKAKAFSRAGLRVAHDLWCLDDHAKGAERVIEQLQQTQQIIVQQIPTAVATCAEQEALSFKFMVAGPTQCRSCCVGGR